MYLRFYVMVGYEVQTLGFSIVEIKISGTSFDRLFVCSKSDATFRNLTKSAQDTGTRLAA